MDKQSYKKYSNQYDSYKSVLDLPTIISSFCQDDYHAMEYCTDIDFVTLIVPFGKNQTGKKYDCVFLKNDLVTYSRMYSEIQGERVTEKSNFLDSAINISKYHLAKEDLSFEEVYPIAFIENSFKYNNDEHLHRGIIFVGRLTDNQDFCNGELAIRNINEKFLFSNPHNKVIFSIVKEHIQEFMLDMDLSAERKGAEKYLNIDVKRKKQEFLQKNNISVNNTSILKNRIINEIKLKKPKRVIDIACGDDTIIYDLLKLGNIKVYANDIALSYITKYHSKQRQYNDIVFTNFNAVDVSFKESAFDVLLCKNLLHHIKFDIIGNLIEHLTEISKQTLIVEILHFDEQNENGKKLHKDFYGKILNETNNRTYLHLNEIEKICYDHQINIDVCDTVETENGVYAYLWISKKNA